MSTVTATYTGQGALRARTLKGDFVDFDPSMAGERCQVPADMAARLEKLGVVSLAADVPMAATDAAGELKALRSAHAALQARCDELTRLNDELEGAHAQLEASNAALVDRVEALLRERDATTVDEVADEAPKKVPSLSKMSKQELVDLLRASKMADGSDAYETFVGEHGSTRQASVSKLREFLSSLSDGDDT